MFKRLVLVVVMVVLAAPGFVARGEDAKGMFHRIENAHNDRLNQEAREAKEKSEKVGQAVAVEPSQPLRKIERDRRRDATTELANVAIGQSDRLRSTLVVGQAGRFRSTEPMGVIQVIDDKNLIVHFMDKSFGSRGSPRRI